ncbi:glycosyltransferase family 2 protein [Microbacterium thalli]|uniref:glycosyltransferase family 2 protein n=1 Tax=Microbacterium thalli TaxID=3027921 RepID=UPI002367014F|nr:glycosyltransferase family A protein [Microbacterium thalli]MDD7930679.1 glycosyltransferase family A protein [Microbacterium thalli]
MTDRRALVSVVLPIHNASDYLDRTLEQLVALNTSVDYEFVLVDDHSVDDSRSRIEQWRTCLPGDVKILDAAERGVAHARNHALSACTGEFVWLTDADDEWSPSIVSEQVTAARESNADIVVCNAVKRAPDGTKVGDITDATVEEHFGGAEALTRLLEGRLQGHLWNKLFRRAVLGADPFPPQRAHSDLGGVLRVLPKARIVSTLPRTLYTYFQNPGSILNGRLYDFSDLRSCLAIAHDRANGGMGARTDDALRYFTYRNVVMPSLNEIARRRSTMSPATARAEAAQVRSLMRWVDSARLLRSKRPRLALQAALALANPTAYMGLYRQASNVVRHLPGMR